MPLARTGACTRKAAVAHVRPDDGARSDAAPNHNDRGDAPWLSLSIFFPGHRFDQKKLWRYLKAHLEDFGVQPAIQQFQGGQSNPTFLITTPIRKYVLRKQPPGKLLPSAHAIDREYRVQAALKGTPVPVVPVQLFCDDTTIIGTPFYLMDYIPGRIFDHAGTFPS